MEEQDPEVEERAEEQAAGEPFEETAERPNNLDVVLDIPVRLSMEVGSTSLSIRKLLQLNKGSVLELARAAGEPLDVLVNGTLVAHGEVVVVNEKFGIRLTDVISPEQRNPEHQLVGDGDWRTHSSGGFGVSAHCCAGFGIGIRHQATQSG